VCNLEIITNIKEYEPNTDKFLISDPILVNSFSSVRLLHNLIINNKDLISARKQFPDTKIVIKFSKV
jgi:hypothetical protein